jgi:hypothetical protein
MYSVVSSELISTPATSIIEIPDNLQQISDFGSAAAIVPSTLDTQQIGSSYDCIA